MKIIALKFSKIARCIPGTLELELHYAVIGGEVRALPRVLLAEMAALTFYPDNTSYCKFTNCSHSR